MRYKRTCYYCYYYYLLSTLDDDAVYSLLCTREAADSHHRRRKTHHHLCHTPPVKANTYKYQFPTLDGLLLLNTTIKLQSRFSPEPKFMALLTKNRCLRKQGILRLLRVFTGQQGILVCVRTPHYQAFCANTVGAEVQRLLVGGERRSVAQNSALRRAMKVGPGQSRTKKNKSSDQL